MFSIIAEGGRPRYWPNGEHLLTAECGRRHGVCGTLGVEFNEGVRVKGSQKPKSAQKKPAQKTLKERRSAKKAAAKMRGITE